MINVKRIDQKEPVTEEFGVLYVGAMFVDPEDLELMIKISKSEALMIDSDEPVSYGSSYKVQLCNVDITYTPRYK